VIGTGVIGTGVTGIGALGALVAASTNGGHASTKPLAPDGAQRLSLRL
jgi:hypothetical protein